MFEKSFFIEDLVSWFFSLLIELGVVITIFLFYYKLGEDVITKFLYF